ncbi:hypothetical protein P7K49_009991 [Saguinus oedipus]|uniref:Uncharacterized protein n=1 Tax=Saguinus oedipus TaxID=9490 RepID=A0ABQ9VM35_SAGOE|nr:hypothetical protein P7K49_009991 [Saguinus oedipus]
MERWSVRGTDLGGSKVGQSEGLSPMASAHLLHLTTTLTGQRPLISDAGYQGEITSVSTACQQLEVFSRVLRTSLATILDGGEENLEKNLPEFAKMVCHGEHTYLFAQAMMSVLAQEEQGGSAVRRIAQEVQRFAQEKGHDASQITLALGTAASYPRACQALGAMLSKGALNPADITVLFKMFTSMDPPPVELVSCSQEPPVPTGQVTLESLCLSDSLRAVNANPSLSWSFLSPILCLVPVRPLPCREP